jgi:hypothetical protein
VKFILLNLRSCMTKSIVYPYYFHSKDSEKNSSVTTLLEKVLSFSRHHSPPDKSENDQDSDSD